MPSLKERLVDVLLTRQLIDKQALDNVLAFQQERGGSLQQLLIEQGLVSETDLLSAISEGLGIPPISLSRLSLDSGLKALIPREVAMQYQLVPVSCIGRTLTIAMADPLDVFALDTVTTMTGLVLNPLLATSNDIRNAIEQYYGSGIEETLREMVQQATSNSTEIMTKSAEAQGDAAQLLIQLQEAPVVKFTDSVLRKAVHLHASDLFIEPREKTVRVRYRVDGVLQEGQAPTKKLQVAVVSRIKVMAELNIAEQRLPQDGHFRFEVDGRAVDFRVSILPSSFGENVCIRILDKSEVKLDINTLGFLAEDLERLKACAQRPHGLILSTGPTGSGKTTSLYALLKWIASPEKNIVTVEDPVEFELPGINQVSTRVEIGLTFARALRSILRQDPDVIMVGEIRDAEAADMAIKSALTGHLVLSTLHTNSAAGSIVRLINMGMEPFLLNSCLTAIIGQRLVRKICQKCREPCHPTKTVAAKLGLLGPDGKPVELARGTGCRACLQSGYAGRAMIAEVLMMTPEVRELVLRGATEREVEHAAKQRGMKTLREHGLAKAVAQITSLEEVFRTTIGETSEE